MSEDEDITQGSEEFLRDEKTGMTSVFDLIYRQIYLSIDPTIPFSSLLQLLPFSSSLIRSSQDPRPAMGRQRVPILHHHQVPGTVGAAIVD